MKVSSRGATVTAPAFASSWMLSVAPVARMGFPFWFPMWKTMHGCDLRVISTSMFESGVLQDVGWPSLVHLCLFFVKGSQVVFN